jgi:hypothetical protein
LIYQYYAQIPRKHDTIYNSVHTKYGGYQHQKLLHLLTLTLCFWPAVNKAESPCDLSTNLMQLLLEHPVQVFHTIVDGKTKDFQY